MSSPADHSALAGLRVLQIANQPGPLVLFEQPVCHALREAGAAVELACMPVGALAGRLAELDFPLHRLPAGRWASPLTWVRLYRTVRRLLRQGHYDLMVAHTPAMSWIARRAARGLGLRTVYLAHGLPFAPRQNPLARWLLRRVEQALADDTDAVMVMNRDDADACRRYRLTRRGGGCFEIPGVGLDVAAWAQPPTPQALADLDAELGLDADRPVVSYVGRFIPSKRPMDMLTLARRLGPGVQVVLAGEGPLWARVQRQARRIGPHVHVVPFLAEPRVLIHRSTVLALPSVFREGLPRVLLEAQAAGRPVVAYDVRGARDALVDGQTGLLVPPADVEAFVAAVARLLAEPATRSALGRAGAERADRVFSLDRAVEAQLACLAAVARAGDGVE